MEFWQTIVATIVGGIITLVATYLTSRGQRKLESSKKRLEKIEHAHTVATRIEHIYRTQWGADLAYLAAGTNDNDRRPKERLPFDELAMLISFYATALKPEVSKLISVCQGDYGKLLARIDSRPSLPQLELVELQDAVTETFNEIKNSVARLQAGLAEIGRSQL